MWLVTLKFLPIMVGDYGLKHTPQGVDYLGVSLLDVR